MKKTVRERFCEQTRLDQIFIVLYALIFTILSMLFMLKHFGGRNVGHEITVLSGIMYLIMAVVFRKTSKLFAIFIGFVGVLTLGNEFGLIP
ncbi:hypothetical protein lbkm_2094 [Lachnospiraceae bacterium KM106-2]|nr:hypothetical protein lbkm_2094 [Lachnospiraceae bacterium KM106-2]